MIEIFIALVGLMFLVYGLFSSNPIMIVDGLIMATYGFWRLRQDKK